MAREDLLGYRDSASQSGAWFDSTPSIDRRTTNDHYFRGYFRGSKFGEEGGRTKFEYLKISG